jgi:polysaccharide deacetylase family protein (PEP-CTERM system associated)
MLRFDAVTAPVNVMSVDVEDYFHVSALAEAAPRERWASFESRVVANTERLLDLFDEVDVKATCFVLGWVAEHHPGLVKTIAARGHEVASHGYWHQLVYDLTPEAFREDVGRSRRLLQDQSGQPVEGYRAPSFSITNRSLWALDVLIEEGYRYDSSIFPVRHDRYGIADAPRDVHRLTRASGQILEAPPATVRLAGQNLSIAGGGYFRLLPYAWHHWGIGRRNRRDKAPAIFYLHPWEIDPGQPHLPAGRLSTFRHYTNLDKTEARLRRLLRTYPFGPMRDVLAAHDTRATGSR